MNPMQKIKDSPHYSRLKESVEYRFDRKQVIIMASVFGGYFLLILLVCLPAVGNAAWDVLGVMMLIMLLIFLPIVAYFVYHWLEIFLRIDSYVFREVVLNRPQVATRGRVKYTVTFTDRHGKSLTRDTSRMFTSQTQPLLEDYNNQTVLIGYNEETDRVVVIQRLDG